MRSGSLGSHNLFRKFIGPPAKAAFADAGPARAGHPSSFTRRGATVFELLVVTAIITILLGILLPAIAQMRQRARDVVCLTRLRHLAAACDFYQKQHHAYPLVVAPVPAATPGPLSGLTDTLLPVLEPQQLDLGLINQLAQFAQYKKISSGLAAIDLPPETQSPDVESEDGRGPSSPGGGISTYYTGYLYTPALGRAPVVQSPGLLPIIPLPLPLPVSLPVLKSPVLLKPGRAPMPEGLARTRAVLWADDVHVMDPGGKGYWQYTHATRRFQPGPFPLTYSSSESCRGQHRIYTDGSGEWVSGKDLGLQDGAPANALNLLASFRTDKAFWWF